MVPHQSCLLFQLEGLGIVVGKAIFYSVPKVFPFCFVESSLACFLDRFVVIPVLCSVACLYQRFFFLSSFFRWWFSQGRWCLGVLLVDGICWFAAASRPSLNQFRVILHHRHRLVHFKQLFLTTWVAAQLFSVHPSLLSQNEFFFLVSDGSYMVQCMSEHKYSPSKSPLSLWQALQLGELLQSP